jgi:hypothetical protein
VAATRHGYVYLLSNPSMPGLVKIGKTTRKPADRVNELGRASGVPTPFRLEAWTWAKDVAKAEREVHQRLAKHRVNDGREFFRIEVDRTLTTARQVAREQRLRLVTRRGWVGGIAAIASLFVYLNSILLLSGVFAEHPLALRLSVFNALIMLGTPGAVWARAAEATRNHPVMVHLSSLAVVATMAAVGG